MSTQTNPPVEVAKALPGKQLHYASRTRTSLFDLYHVSYNSSAIRCTCHAVLNYELGLAWHEPRPAERLSISTRNSRQ